MLKIVHIGFGYWGANVVRNIMKSKQFDLVAICDSQESKIINAKKQYDQTNIVFSQEYEQYLNDPEINAFSLAIQTEPSFEVAKDIIRAGKHLFIEKPIASNASLATELVELAKENNVKIHCDHIMIYHPIIRYIKKLYDSGELGDLIYFDISRMNLGPIRKDVNAMLDLAVHDLAVIDYISGGCTPNQIEAMGERRFGQNEALTYLTMKFDNFIAHIKSSWISPVKERRVMIGFTKKMVIFDDMSISEKLRIYNHGIISIDENEGYGAYEFKARTGDVLIPNIQAEDALLNSIDHFADCVLNDHESLSGGAQSVKVMEILDAASDCLQK